MKRIISSLLIVALLLLSSCAPSDKNGDDAEGTKSTIDDIPQTSTIPPYSEEHVHIPDSLKYRVNVFFFGCEEANEAYRLLKENGNELEYEIVNFDYTDDELFPGFWFSGTLTEDSYINREGKSFYELEYEHMAMYAGLFYKDIFDGVKFKGLGSYGIDDYAESVVRPYLTVSLSKAYLPTDGSLPDSEGYVLTLSESFDCEYAYDVTCNGELFLLINSDAEISPEMFNKIKSTLVFIEG